MRRWIVSASVSAGLVVAVAIASGATAARRAKPTRCRLREARQDAEPTRVSAGFAMGLVDPAWLRLHDASLSAGRLYR